MREIKFRAWDGEVMHTDNVCMLGGVFALEENTMDWSFNFEEKLMVMQFTGLKDKNGIDIYEGDILNAYHSGFEESIVADVRFKSATFTIGKYWKDGTHDWTSMEQYEKFDLEVIGNIHENPELRG